LSKPSTLTKRNKTNAAKSTGPRSKTGKRRSSKNALRHGIFSKELILSWEDENELAELVTQIQSDLQPDGIIQTVLADQVAMHVWRLKRLTRAESGMFEDERLSRLMSEAQIEVNSYLTSVTIEGPGLAELRPFLEEYETRTESMITDEKAHAGARQRIQRLSEQRGCAGLRFARTLRRLTADDTLLKLARYGTSIERSLMRCLREIRELQSSREPEGGGG